MNRPPCSPDGTLTFQAKRYVSGVVRVVVRLRDTGGTANGGDDTGERNFNLLVNTLNQPPVWNAADKVDNDTPQREDDSNPAAFTSVPHRRTPRFR